MPIEPGLRADVLDVLDACPTYSVGEPCDLARGVAMHCTGWANTGVR
jgi:hypothetical protein